MKCGFSGCKSEATWACKKLWASAKGEVLHTCDQHKPDPAKRGPALQHLPFFYDVQPIAAPTFPGDVTDATTAREFLRWCCATIGIGFHPDIEFTEYEPALGEPDFPPAELRRMERLLAVTFTYLDDVYAECLKMPPFKDQN